MPLDIKQTGIVPEWGRVPLPPILLMTHSLLAGGSERQACEMAIALHKRGWPVHYGCIRAEGPFTSLLRDAGIPLTEFATPSFASALYPRAGWRFMRYLRQNGIRLAHSFDSPSRLIVVPFGRLAGLPAVLSSHRGSITFFANDSKMRHAIHWTNAWSHAIVANCKAMQQELLAGDNRVPPGKVHLTYNGIDPELYKPGASTVRPAYLAPDDVVIGCVAGLRPEKDFLTLIDAFAEVRQDHPETRLLLVGSGSDRGRLASRIAELQIASVAHLEPETRDVQSWLRCLNIFVLPSLTEAFSNSLMEAMSTGCICIASSVGGNPELIERGKTGLLFEAGNANDLAAQLRAILSNRARAADYASAARVKIIEQFSIEAATGRLEAIYKQRLGLPA